MIKAHAAAMLLSLLFANTILAADSKSHPNSPLSPRVMMGQKPGVKFIKSSPGIPVLKQETPLPLPPVDMMEFDGFGENTFNRALHEEQQILEQEILIAAANNRAHETNSVIFNEEVLDRLAQEEKARKEMDQALNREEYELLADIGEIDSLLLQNETQLFPEEIANYPLHSIAEYADQADQEYPDHSGLLEEKHNEQYFEGFEFLTQKNVVEPIEIFVPGSRWRSSPIAPENSTPLNQYVDYIPPSRSSSGSSNTDTENDAPVPPRPKAAPVEKMEIIKESAPLNLKSIVLNRMEGETEEQYATRIFEIMEAIKKSDTQECKDIRNKANKVINDSKQISARSVPGGTLVGTYILYNCLVAANTDKILIDGIPEQEFKFFLYFLKGHSQRPNQGQVAKTRELSISHPTWDDELKNLLAEVMKCNKIITHLHFWGGQTLSTDAFLKLSQALRDNPFLKSLRFDRAEMTSDELHFFLTTFRVNTHLEEFIIIPVKKFNERDIEHVLLELEQNCHFTEFKLWDDQKKPSKDLEDRINKLVAKNKSNSSPSKSSDPAKPKRSSMSRKRTVSKKDGPR